MPEDNRNKESWQINGLKKLKFYDDYLEYKGQRIDFNNIKSVEFTSTATKHSINFIPTGTSYESILYLILLSGKQVHIKQESRFWGRDSEKEYSEAIWKASEIISITTFNSRLEPFEKDFNEKGFFKVDQFQINKNGDLFKNKNLLFNINDKDIKVSLGPFQIYISQSRKGFSRILGAKEYLIPIHIDRDCILYMLKNFLGYSFKDTHVREKVIDRRTIFFHAILKLSAKIAKADGHVSIDEIKVFKEYFDFDKYGIKDAGKIFDQSVNSSERVEDIAKAIFSSVGDNRELLEYIVIGLLQIAGADGIFHYNEIKLLDKIIEIFDFSEREKEGLFALFGIEDKADQDNEGPRGGTFEDPIHVEKAVYFRILNLEPGATTEEIKSAYRVLARKHHPDVLHSKGIPTSEIKKSENILKMINEAYSQLIPKNSIN